MKGVREMNKKIEMAKSSLMDAYDLMSEDEKKAFDMGEAFGYLTLAEEQSGQEGEKDD